MDEKDLEIARLRGQVEAYQEQLRSMAIELLRKQVRDLQKGEAERDLAVQTIQASFGRLQANVDERLSKASAAFVELKKQVQANGAKGE